MRMRTLLQVHCTDGQGYVPRSYAEIIPLASPPPPPAKAAESPGRHVIALYDFEGDPAFEQLSIRCVCVHVARERDTHPETERQGE